MISLKSNLDLTIFPYFPHQPAVNELGSKGFLLGLRGGTGLWQKSLCSSTFSLSKGAANGDLFRGKKRAIGMDGNMMGFWKGNI